MSPALTLSMEPGSYHRGQFAGYKLILVDANYLLTFNDPERVLLFM